jgi:hypothetical protein
VREVARVRGPGRRAGATLSEPPPRSRRLMEVTQARVASAAGVAILVVVAVAARSRRRWSRHLAGSRRVWTLVAEWVVSGGRCAGVQW